MRVTVNVATRPFVELRPIYRRLRAWMVLLFLLAIPLWYVARNEQKKADAATARVRQMQVNVQKMQNQQQDYQGLMRQPQNAAVLTQSDFLNDLFRRKAFSWTATLTDLETVLPAGVQVMSIDPQVAPDGHVTIRMRVSGERQRAIEVVKNLESSKHFASPRLAGEALASSSNGNQQATPVNASDNVNFDILADYRPLPLDEEQPHKRDREPEQQQKGGAQ
ncbi:fimbrial assembly protein [Alloacidobacterium sp.]|uniref:fimbrial assembly protein n=1 Tax=Alloacidobacterium sp. TaxID=2951999 RepID=UPI002D5E3521|nr:fimbrial assembly protein [Alloacidobacterium sp.]HYK38086.1 fimbrial assembly protein [Alloacidobacterium sp.]